jgi:hypothetical protein
MITELKACSPIHNELAQELADKWGVSIHTVRAAAVRTEGVEYVRLPHNDASPPAQPVPPVQVIRSADAGCIADYMILSAKTQAALAQDVRKWIGVGWTPFGGVSAAAFGMSPVGGNQYLQAMVKYG